MNRPGVGRTRAPSWSADDVLQILLEMFSVVFLGASRSSPFLSWHGEIRDRFADHSGQQLLP